MLEHQCTRTVFCISFLSSINFNYVFFRRTNICLSLPHLWLSQFRSLTHFFSLLLLHFLACGTKKFNWSNWLQSNSCNLIAHTKWRSEIVFIAIHTVIRLHVWRMINRHKEWINKIIIINLKMHQDSMCVSAATSENRSERLNCPLPFCWAAAIGIVARISHRPNSSRSIECACLFKCFFFIRNSRGEIETEPRHQCNVCKKFKRI